LHVIPGHRGLLWKYAPAPQSKPVAPAYRLVARSAPSVAFRLELRFWPQGQHSIQTVLLFKVFV
jgi:hypothetical protein